MLIYIEEALEESPELRGLEASWDEIRLELAKVLRTLSAAETESQRGSTKLLEDVQKVELLAKEVGADKDKVLLARETILSQAAMVADVKSCMIELREAIQPKFIWNRESKTLHAAKPYSSALPHPREWQCACGWHWATSADARPILSDSAAQEGASLCFRCAPHTDVDSLGDAWREVLAWDILEMLGR